VSDLSSSAPQAGDGARLPRIDILRGIAILVVILYHLDNLIILRGGWGLARGADGSAHMTGAALLRLAFLPFHMGRVGVNLFFVISGLCIHLRFARQRAADPGAPFSLSTFFARRFFRIYPVYWAALGLGAFVAPFLYRAAYGGVPPGETGGVAPLPDILAHAVMLHGFSKYQMMSIISSLWSIGTEEQFYLLYPLVFVLLGRRVPVPRLVLGLLGLTLAWRLTLVLTNPPPPTFFDGPFLVWVFGFSLPRYYEWSLGALLAWAIAEGKTLPGLLALFVPARLRAMLGARPRLLMLVGLGFILAGAASLLRVQVKWIFEDPCYSTGWFLIMAAALLPAETRAAAPSASVTARGRLAAARAFVAARLQSLGRRSFSVYLVHEIVLTTVAWLMVRFHLPPITVAAPLACVLVWAVCYPFYRYVEAPFEERSKMVGRKRAAGPAPAAIKKLRTSSE
jgi:peptidoglycan/LPS O-acetylase OafA/YrhL